MGKRRLRSIKQSAGLLPSALPHLPPASQIRYGVRHFNPGQGRAACTATTGAILVAPFPPCDKPSQGSPA